ncbi:MAG: Sec-independent protein translocase subunit TatA [Pseudomonadota bacterium]|nr:Sec-independent protein translocase subunit TatA [Pseudomonadota bacterium]
MPQGWELIIILALVFLLFGAKKMPDAARGIGRSLRILKTETKGLRDDDDASPSVDDTESAQIETNSNTAEPISGNTTSPPSAADIRDEKESVEPKTVGKE